MGKQRGCSVYVVASEKCKPVKIGHTKNAAKRLGSIQTGSPVKLFIHENTEMMSLPEAKAIEARVHEALKDHRMNGEWFDVDVQDAVDAIWNNINSRIYSARMLCCFDTRGYVDPRKRKEIENIALLSMEKQCPSNQANQATPAVDQR